ncbi:MAG: hypothetical protein V4447_10625 [Pseudomonadota bacterium]
MTLSATSMATRIEAYMAAVPAQQIVGPGAIGGYRNALMIAMCQGIIDEITQDAVVHTVDSRGDTCNNGTIT